MFLLKLSDQMRAPYNEIRDKHCDTEHHDNQIEQHSTDVKESIYLYCQVMPYTCGRKPGSNHKGEAYNSVEQECSLSPDQL